MTNQDAQSIIIKMTKEFSGTCETVEGIITNRQIKAMLVAADVMRQFALMECEERRGD